MESAALHGNLQQQCTTRAYILQSQVVHRRFLPAETQHSFAYSTLSLLLSLDALESKQLDLWRGLLFGYGGVWGRVTGIRPSTYLYDNLEDKRSIKQKLESILTERGLPGSELRDAWLLTMPSFLGYEGLNPLSVYYCYRRGNSELWLVVLETHNTFGERHVDVLETGMNEDTPRKSGVDHQWKIPRQFHVSPFNDRSGFYLCRITVPSHPPFPCKSLPLAPLPTVTISLLTASSRTQVKQIAIFRPTHSVPLSGVALLTALAHAPFSLLLTFPRILYNAYILHYCKRLNVYQRPEPRAVDPAVETRLPAVRNAVQIPEVYVGGGIGWQPEGSIEAWCRCRVYAFLRRRCVEVGASVTFISSNPFHGQTVIAPSGEAEVKNALSIYYRSPRLFTTLFVMPSAEHAILYGSQAEKLFSVSSKELFISIFAASSAATSGASLMSNLEKRVRSTFVPSTLVIHPPFPHPLDDPKGFMPVVILLTLWFLATMGRRSFILLGVRFVPGDEPRDGWGKLHPSGEVNLGEYHLGSLRQEE